MNRFDVDDSEYRQRLTGRRDMAPSRINIDDEFSIVIRRPALPPSDHVRQAYDAWSRTFPAVTKRAKRDHELQVLAVGSSVPDSDIAKFRREFRKMAKLATFGAPLVRSGRMSMSSVRPRGKPISAKTIIVDDYAALEGLWLGHDVIVNPLPLAARLAWRLMVLPPGPPSEPPAAQGTPLTRKRGPHEPSRKGPPPSRDWWRRR